MRPRLLLMTLSTIVKKISNSFWFLLTCHLANAQSLINSTGSTVSDNIISIEYSIGEIATSTLSTANNNITQGLLQPIVQIGIDPCKVLDFIPNAFTPNNDGLNDCYGMN